MKSSTPFVMGCLPMKPDVCRHGLLAAALLVLVACDSPPPAAMPEPAAVPLSVITVQAEDVELVQSYPARVQGARTVEVRARVEGILQQRLFEEGEYVEQGQPLFQLDPAPFQAGLGVRLGEQRTAEAEQRQAERDWKRIAELYDSGSISARDRDQALAALEVADSRLALAEAWVESARIDLGYTRVDAPLSGVTSLEVLAEGSFVERYAHLATIVQVDPVQVLFSLPEADATRQRKALSAGGQQRSEARQVMLELPDGQPYPTAGSIDFTASVIDPATGSVASRALFPNPEGLLVPGQFVRIRVRLETLSNAVLVPETALRTGADGRQLFVVEDGQARMRSVTAGPLIGGRRVILDGLAAGEQLVVSGHSGLQDGMAVSVSSTR